MELKTPQDYERELFNIMEDYKNIINGTNKVQPATTWVCHLDKPIKMRTNDSSEFVCKLEDKGEYYTHLFPRFGTLKKKYTDDFNWIIDDKTILFFERPYRGRVVKLLNKLLPNYNIRPVHNDIIINNYKMGPSFMCGQVNDMGDYENNPPTSSIVYCLRWTDAEGLDKYFAGDPNHEKRKSSNTPLGSLDMFLKNITKEEFEQMLEEME